MDFRQRITRLREDKGLEKKELAKMLPLSPSMVSEWERGERDVTRENLEKLADIFNVSVDYLLGRTDVPNPVAPPSPDLSLRKSRPITVLGATGAGVPTQASHTEVEEVDVKVVGNSADDRFFFVRVSDDSIIGSRIAKGDLVLIHEQQRVENGEIAAVVVGASNLLLRRVFWRTGSAVLTNECPGSEPLLVSGNDIRVFGRAVRVIRDLK